MERLTLKEFESVECEPYVLGGIEYYGDSYGGEVINKLAEYEDLEEQGLLLRLPCTIGTTVYAVVRECEGDSFECYHTCDTCTWSDTHIKEVIFDIEYIGDVGNWIFLTKEEAEQALAEMKGV